MVPFCGFPLVNNELALAVLNFEKSLKRFSVFPHVRFAPPPESKTRVYRGDYKVCTETVFILFYIIVTSSVGRQTCMYSIAQAL